MAPIANTCPEAVLLFHVLASVGVFASVCTTHANMALLAHVFVDVSSGLSLASKVIAPFYSSPLIKHTWWNCCGLERLTFRPARAASGTLALSATPFELFQSSNTIHLCSCNCFLLCCAHPINLDGLPLSSPLKSLPPTPLTLFAWILRLYLINQASTTAPTRIPSTTLHRYVRPTRSNHLRPSGHGFEW